MATFIFVFLFLSAVAAIFGFTKILPKSANAARGASFFFLVMTVLLLVVRVFKMAFG